MHMARTRAAQRLLAGAKSLRYKGFMAGAKAHLSPFLLEVKGGSHGQQAGRSFVATAVSANLSRGRFGCLGIWGDADS